MQKIQERRSFGALRESAERGLGGTSLWLVRLGGGLSFATVGSCSSYIVLLAEVGPGFLWRHDQASCCLKHHVRALSAQ